MKKLMKRLDQSQKDINLEKSHKRELDKLKELYIHGRLDNQSLNEKFGEKDESSRERVDEEEKIRKKE
jgi:hypothetical protein